VSVDDELGGPIDVNGVGHGAPHRSGAAHHSGNSGAAASVSP
jgi:hypothetical protein